MKIENKIFAYYKAIELERCTLKRKGLNLLIVFIFLVTLFSGLIESTYVQAAPLEQPKINGKAGITVDIKTGEIIYAYEIDNKMFPASVTKLLTALIFANSKNKTDLIPYTQSAKAQPQYALSIDKMPKIKIGDTMSADDVMKSLLLFSANDAAYMIADSVSGNSTNFAKAMNDEIAKLNLKGTHFVTPNGLHDPEHYTTPYDLSVIGRAAFNNPWVKEVLGLEKDMIRTTSGIIASVENRNKLLNKDGFVGGKTGYTDPAGRCLVAFYEKDGRSLVGVVMRAAYDAEDTMVFNDMKTIINWSLQAKPTVLYAENTVLETKTFSYKPFKFFGPIKTMDVPVILKDEISYYENSINAKELKAEATVENIDPWKLTSDSKIGKLSVSQREVNKTVDLYTNVTSKDLVKANRGLYIFAGVGAFALFILLVIIVLVVTKGFRRKKRYRY